VQRIFLHYKGEYVHLPDGETIVGRDLACRLRFNDPAVSRRHFRILVDEETASIEDLGSTNGTKVNRVMLKSEVPLCHRDKILVGGRELTVYFLDEDEYDAEGPESSTLVDRPPPKPPAHAPRSLQLAAALAESASRKQTCGFCGGHVDPSDERCKSCGQIWSDFRAHSATVVHKAIDSAERRRHPRAPVKIPVVYISDSLEVQSVAKDLSLSGVFISTEFLDPVGTKCNVTVLLDGGPAFELSGRVSRVVQSGHPEGIPPGLGIEFESMGGDARQWLWRTLKSQLGEASVAGDFK